MALVSLAEPLHTARMDWMSSLTRASKLTPPVTSLSKQRNRGERTLSASRGRARSSTPSLVSHWFSSVTGPAEMPESTAAPAVAPS